MEEMNLQGVINKFSFSVSEIMGRYRSPWKHNKGDFNICHLMKRHFAYVLFKKGQVIYCGASSDVPARMLIHKYTKRFDNVDLYEVQSAEDARTLEACFAKQFKPNSCKIYVSGKWVEARDL